MNLIGLLVGSYRILKSNGVLNQLKLRGTIDNTEYRALHQLATLYYGAGIRELAELEKRITKDCEDNRLLEPLKRLNIAYVNDDITASINLAHNKEFRERLWHFYSKHLAPRL